MRAEVCAQVTVEGFHRWPDAAEFEPSVAFLADRHRHLFVIRAWMSVEHNDRDIEFIKLGRDIKDYLYAHYGEPCEFGALSCEALAMRVINVFGLTRCEVWEDAENGALVSR